MTERLCRGCDASQDVSTPAERVLVVSIRHAPRCGRLAALRRRGALSDLWQNDAARTVATQHVSREPAATGRVLSDLAGWQARLDAVTFARSPATRRDRRSRTPGARPSPRVEAEPVEAPPPINPTGDPDVVDGIADPVRARERLLELRALQRLMTQTPGVGPRRGARAVNRTDAL